MDRRFFRAVTVGDRPAVAVRTDGDEEESGFAWKTAFSTVKKSIFFLDTLLIIFLIFVILAPTGCSSKIVDLTPVKKHPELLSGMTDSFGNLKPDTETAATLRERQLDQNRLSNLEKIARLQEESNDSSDIEVLTTLIRLGYFEAVRQEKERPELAAELHIGVILNSYRFLFDPIFENARNPFDSRYQEAARDYNRSTERLLRMIVRHQKNNDASLAPGNDIDVALGDRTWRIRCQMKESAWRPEEIGEIRFASDFKVEGLTDHYGQTGLGVPMIVTRRRIDRGEEVYYPSDLTFPMTLFLRPNPTGATPRASNVSDQSEPHVLLEFHDPLVQKTTIVGQTRVPLAVDLTTPLASNFIDPTVIELGTLGLTRPEKFFEPLSGEKNLGRTRAGFYMFAPYAPDKIPVIMVHGLWSSPMTWLAMVSAFQNDPKIWDHYQFWLWCYPTGLPWWVSAAGLRTDLEKIRLDVDPARTNPRLDEMVVIGYSMGGLIARLQVCESGDQVWKLVSDKPFTPESLRDFGGKNEKWQEEFDGNNSLKSLFFFHPNPSIRRVITIATPFKGSDSVNSFSQWLADKMIAPPEKFNRLSELLNSAHVTGQKENLLSVRNSIESMSPDSPFYQILDRLQTPDGVTFNNIIGMTETGIVFKKLEGDKIVRYESAHRDDVESEIVVDAFHTFVHTDPASIRETARILHENLHPRQARRQADTLR